MIEPILSDAFYHDGRGPELVRVIWGLNGLDLRGFEYLNPDDAHRERDLKHLILEEVQVFAMAGEEVHGKSVRFSGNRSSIFRLRESDWKKEYNPYHLSGCEHYQIIFYDEIFDVICRDITAGSGPFPKDHTTSRRMQ